MIQKGSKRNDQLIGHQERKLVFAVALKILRDEDAAGEVAQEALLRAHRNLSKFRGESKFSTWLYRIATTSSLMHLRKQRRWRREIPMSDLDPVPATSNAASRQQQPSPFRDLQGRQLFRTVDQELQRVGEIYREVFWLRYGDGYSEKEIAGRLKLPLTTVKSRSFRARSQVRAHLLSVGAVAND